MVDDQGNPISYQTEPTDDNDEPIDTGGELNSEQDEATQQTDDSNISSRDILSELLVIAQIMVTGGEEREEEKFSRNDKSLLKDALYKAAGDARRNNKDDVLTEDVVTALRSLVKESPEFAARITEMANNISLFCDDFAGELFNRPGEPLPDADFIRIEMGTLAGGNDKDKLSVAYITIINQIIARAERTQRDGRHTINLTDEAHVITGDKLLSRYMVIVSKLMGRRMGLWLWQATQNMKDYKDEARKMLSMFEWWIILNVDKEELDNVERFKKFDADQRTMLLNTRKVDKKYSEGVVFGGNMEAFFRNIPPSLCFALCMTEKHEKTQREQIMQENNCTELEAVNHVSDFIRQSRLAKEVTR